MSNRYGNKVSIRDTWTPSNASKEDIIRLLWPVVARVSLEMEVDADRIMSPRNSDDDDARRAAILRARQTTSLNCAEIGRAFGVSFQYVGHVRSNK